MRICSITGCSRIAAMIFSEPQQFGQCSTSISNTRLEQLGPAQPHRAVVRTTGLALDGRGGLRRRLWLLQALALAALPGRAAWPKL